MRNLRVSEGKEPSGFGTMIAPLLNLKPSQRGCRLQLA